MLHRRWLFVACVTLSQACDSKPKEVTPPPPPIAPLAGPQVIATEHGILVDGTQVVAIEDGMIPADSTDDDGRPVRLAEKLAQIDRAIDSLHLRVDPALPSHIVFQILQAAPAHVTRFVLASGVAVRRKSTPTTKLDVGRIEIKLGAQVIATEPAAQRTAALDAALRASRGKSIEVAVEPWVSYRVLSEVVGTAAPYFEEVRLSRAPRSELMTMMSLQLFITGPLASQIDEQPLVECVKDALPELQELVGLRVRIRFALDDKGTITNVLPIGRHVPEVLGLCFTRVVQGWKLKLPAGNYEVPMDLRSR